VLAPAEQLEEIYEKVWEQAEKEEATRAEILKGATVEELLAKFGRL
jgi:regulator of RNase E activity RraA